VNKAFGRALRNSLFGNGRLVFIYVASGEYWLTVGQEVKHLKAGDKFRLARNVPHEELYGPQGATVWVARAY